MSGFYSTSLIAELSRIPKVSQAAAYFEMGASRGVGVQNWLMFAHCMPEQPTNDAHAYAYA